MQRKKIVLAITLALGMTHNTSYAQFDPTLELSDLNGFNGFNINGAANLDLLGRSVSKAGDINGDGIDDVIVGAYRADSSGGVYSGSSYVVFGSTGGFTNPIDAASLDGSKGFIINGASIADQSGRAVSGAGDVNGDGIDDVIIGAFNASPNGNSSAGTSYVVFGSTTGFSSKLNLSNLNGTNGFSINGVASNDESGWSVSTAGDVNADGIDDVIIGSKGNNGAGTSYVVFGSSAGFASSINLSSLDGNNGFKLNGVASGDHAGFAVSNAGDVNGDGIDDLIIGAYLANADGATAAGTSYVVFGSATGFSSSFNLSSLNALNGFTIWGESAYDFSGFSVSTAGDINGDGIDDLIIGAPFAASQMGTGYVVFGSDTGLPNPLKLSDIDGQNGFKVIGAPTLSGSGRAVSATGDVNADGIDDILIGAPDSPTIGVTYVVFGSTASYPESMSISELNGHNGFSIRGVSSFEASGSSVSSAGDINGDGIDDVLIGAPFANPNGDDTGASYVLFGREKPIFENGFDQ